MRKLFTLFAFYAVLVPSVLVLGQSSNNERDGFIKTAQTRLSASVGAKETGAETALGRVTNAVQTNRTAYIQAVVALAKCDQQIADIQSLLPAIRGNPSLFAYYNNIYQRLVLPANYNRYRGSVSNSLQALNQTEAERIRAETAHKTIAIGNAKNMAILDYLIGRWENGGKADTDWLVLLRYITSAANSTGINSDVTVKFVPASNVAANPKSKLSVRYKREGESEESRASTFSANTTITLPIGFYYFWVERDGVPVSDKTKKYPIVRQTEPPIVITENKK